MWHDTAPHEDWAAGHALEAILGDLGREAPAVSPAGWLKTLLDEIDASPEIRRILERDDPDSMREMLRECREMSDDLMTAVLLLAPPDDRNLGYQACVDLEFRLRLQGIGEGDEIVISRQDHGEGKGYWLGHQKSSGGHDYYEFDEQGQPVR